MPNLADTMGDQEKDRETGYAMAPEALCKALAALCRPFGEISAIRFYCRRRVPDELVCFIDMKGNLAKAAEAVRGAVFGQESICLAERLAAGFCCPGRRDGHLIASTCCACRFVGDML